jgi:hypothetical protein
MRFLFRTLAAVGFALAIAAGAFAVNGNSAQGHFRVLDKNGRLVGYSLTDNLVAREINGTWVTFYTQSGLGIFDSGAIYVHYLTTDCSGPRYVTHYSNFSEGTRVGPTMYYPADAQVLTPRSLRVFYGNGDEGLCALAPDVSGVYGLATTVDVNSFGLEPPFKAVQ